MSDYHRWIGELYIKMCEWQKAAHILEATVKEQREPKAIVKETP